MQDCIRIGYQDGVNAIKAGEGVMAKKYHQKLKEKFSPEQVIEFYTFPEEEEHLKVTSV
jgi:hypothetical protein